MNWCFMFTSAWLAGSAAFAAGADILTVSLVSSAVVLGIESIRFTVKDKR